jgi:uncharacterized membrane protein
MSPWTARGAARRPRVRFLIENIASKLRTSFWFLPGLFMLAGVVLAAITLAVDDGGFGWLGFLQYLVRGEIESARILLSVLGTGIITVTSIVFSITMVTLSIATNQFGPRLIRTFMRDRTNQASLGAFLMTFIFCILILVNMPGTGGEVPRLSLTVAVLLTFASVGVLVHFIHHVAVAVQADTVVRRVTQEIYDQTDRLFPDQIGTAGAKDDAPDGPWESIPARKTGYLQSVDGKRLIKTCIAKGCIVRLHIRPGRYIVEGLPLLEVFPAKVLDERLRARILKAFIIADRRTEEHDIQFPIDQLVEITVRSLSTGINDAAVAIACLDGLSGTLCKCALAPTPSPFRYAKGRLFLIAPPVTFPEILADALGPIRQNARSNHAAAAHFLSCLERVAAYAQSAEHRAAVRSHAIHMLEDGRREHTNSADLAVLQDRFNRVLRALRPDKPPHPAPTET